MFKKFKKLLVIAGLTGIVLVCVSAAKGTVLVPVTTILMEEIGTANLERLGYYLSKEIKLERLDYFRENIQFEEGVAVRIDKNVRDVIVISPKVSGAATSNIEKESKHVNYRVLGVAFEDTSANSVGLPYRWQIPKASFRCFLTKTDRTPLNTATTSTKSLTKAKSSPTSWSGSAKTSSKKTLPAKHPAGK